MGEPIELKSVASAQSQQWDYRSIAQALSTQDMKRLSPEQVPHIVVCLEWMRDQALELVDRQGRQEAELAQREASLATRESEVETKLAVVNAAIRTRSLLSPSKTRRWFNRGTAI